MHFVQLIQMPLNQVLDGLRYVAGIGRADVAPDDGEPLQEESPVDENRSLGREMKSPLPGLAEYAKNKKPLGIGRAQDGRFCVQNGSEAYCPGQVTAW